MLNKKLKNSLDTKWNNDKIQTKRQNLIKNLDMNQNKKKNIHNKPNKNLVKRNKDYNKNGTLDHNKKLDQKVEQKEKFLVI